MRALLALLCLVFAPAAAFAQAVPSPSAEIIALRDRFEAAFVREERRYEGDARGLRQIAIRLGEDIYGEDWDAVRAEASRSYAALPEIDLEPYARREGVQPLADIRMFRDLPEGALAAMRFYDAEQVGNFVVAWFAMQHLFGMYDPTDESAAEIALRLTTISHYMQPRVYRGRFEGRDVLAASMHRVFVIAPYTQHARGFLMPDVAALRLYEAE